MAIGKIKSTDLIEADAIQSIITDAANLETQLKAILTVNAQILENNPFKTAKDVEQFEAATNSVTSATKALNDVQKLQVEQQKKLTELTDEKLKQNLQAQMDAKERRAQLTEQIKLEKENLGTLEKLTLQNAKLTKERKTLNLETEKGRKRLQEINNELDKNNKFIKENSDATTKQRMNVGNYTQSIINAIPALKGMKIGQEGLNLAMKANPIGLIITLLMGLFGWLKQSTVITDALTFATSGLSSALRFIKDIIVDTVTNFDKFTEAIKNPIKFIKELASGAKKAAQEGFDAAKAMDKFTVSLAKNEQAIAKNENLAKSLEKQLRNESISLKERAKIADKIVALDVKNAEIREKIAKEELRANELNLRGKTLNADEEASIIRLKTKVLQAESDKQIAIEEGAARKARLLLRDDKQQRIEEKKKEKADLSNLEEQFLMDERQRLINNFDKKLTLLREQGEAETKLFIAVEKAKRQALKDFDKQQLVLAYQQKQRQIKVLEDLEIQEIQNRLDRVGKEEIEKRKQIDEEIRQAKIKQLERMQRDILMDESKTLNERLLLAQEFENQIIKLSQTTNNKAKELAALQAEIAKKSTEILKKQISIQQQFTKQQTNDQIKLTQDRISRESQLAAMGMENRLAEQEAAAAKLEAQRIRQERRQMQAQKALAYLETFRGFLKDGDNPGSATAKTSIIMAAIASSLGGFFEGTESLGEKDKAKPFFNTGKDDYLIRAHKGERIIPTAMNKHLKPYNNEEVVDIVNAHKRGSNYVSTLSDPRIIDELKNVQKSISNIELAIDWDAYDRRIERKIERGTKTIIKTATQRPRL